MLEGAGVLHRPFLRSFRGVGIFSVARHVSAQQLRLWLCSLRELPFSMQKKPSSCATAFMASSSKKRPAGIEKMRKSDLVEVARKELGMSLAEAKAKTLAILKKEITINRGLRRWTLGRAMDYMKKSDLAVVARKELGMSLAQANALKSEILKSEIRTALKWVIGPPPRFWDMKMTELRDEVHTRGLPVIPNATRVQMKRQIQEDADARTRTWLSTAATNAEARRTSTVDEH